MNYVQDYTYSYINKILNLLKVSHKISCKFNITQLKKAFAYFQHHKVILLLIWMIILVILIKKMVINNKAQFALLLAF